MEHIIQLAISVEDEKIIHSIEENAEKQVFSNLTDRIEDIICSKYGYYGTGTRNKDYTPLKEMVQDKVDDILMQNKDFILSEASNILGEKLARSKRGKEILEGLEV